MAKKKIKFKFNIGGRVSFQSCNTGTCGTGVIVGQNPNGGERLMYDIISDDGEWDMAFEDMCDPIGQEQESLEKGFQIKKNVFKELESIIESNNTTIENISNSINIQYYKIADFPEYSCLKINDFFQILAVLGYNIKLEVNETLRSQTIIQSKPSYKIGDIVEYNDYDKLKSGRVLNIISDSIIGNIGILEGDDGYNFYDVGTKAKVMK